MPQRATWSLCRRSELAVVPGSDPGRFDHVSHPLAGGVRDVLLHRLRGHPGHPAGYAAADLQHPGRVLNAPDPPRHLHSAQLEVVLPGLHQAGDARVTGQVAGLLRGPVGPECDLPPEHHVEHRHQVRGPVAVDRGELELAGPGEHRRDLRVGHRDPVALLHPAVPRSLPGAPKPMVSVARARVSSQAKPACGGAPSAPSGPGNSGPSARCTESSVHMPSAEPYSAASTVARIRGGSITAATPPCTTNTSPLIPAAAGPARYTTSGATCSAASGSTASPGGAPIRSAVMAVRARGQMALARTPYRPQLRAVVTVSVAIPALAAA